MSDLRGAIRRCLLALPFAVAGLGAAAQDDTLPNILDGLLGGLGGSGGLTDPLIAVPGSEGAITGTLPEAALPEARSDGEPTPEVPEDAPAPDDAPLAAEIVAPDGVVAADPGTPEGTAEVPVPGLDGEAEGDAPDASAAALPTGADLDAGSDGGRPDDEAPAAESAESVAATSSASGALLAPPAAIITPEGGPTLQATGALPPARSFLMGFTPLPYDLTPEAFDETYLRIAEHGDIVSHLFDEGVPWTAAMNGTTFHPNVEADIARRLAGTRASSAVLLSVTPLAQDRLSLAGEWAEAGGLPLPESLEGLPFDDPEIVSAFVGYALRMIDRFDPDYFAYALEITDLAGDPEAREAFVGLAAEVYRAIKRVHPDLPVFPTWSLGNRTAFTDELRDFMAEMEPWSDVLAVSTYPYVWDGVGGEADRLPADWFSKFAEAMPGKPFAVAQTGFLSGTYRNLPNLVWVSAGPEDQAGYVGALLEEAERLRAEFVIWYVPVDYDALWARLESMGMSEWFAQWMRTGLWSADFQPRPALDVWMDWFALPVWAGDPPAETSADP